MEKCLHKIRENFSSYATVCSWFISAFFLTIKFEFGRKQIFQIDDDPRDTRKSWVILLEAIDAKNSMIRHCCILRQKYTLPS